MVTYENILQKLGAKHPLKKDGKLTAQGENAHETLVYIVGGLADMDLLDGSTADRIITTLDEISEGRTF